MLPNLPFMDTPKNIGSTSEDILYF